MNREELLLEFKQAVINQFREAGNVGLVTADAPDTGKTYVIFSDQLIPFDEADALMLEIADEV